ncbi:transposase family protein [Streptomyces sp. NPDC090036]|uniref:transposase family protein n=1 Tax=Streptomyces sp. NPDC090036 TaxID=3365926 RepID=UPI00382CB911
MTEINEVAERVAARRAELDEEEKLLAERLDAVRAEREELVVAMRVWERMHAQLDAERPSAQAATVQVGGCGVLLVPHREAGAGEEVLPPDYQRLMKRRPGRPWLPRPHRRQRRPGDRHRLQGHPRRKLTPGEKQANRVLAAARAPVEHGFAHLKTWRILTKLRTDPARATDLLRALLVLSNLELSR